MHHASVPGFDIDYDVDVSCPGGFDVNRIGMMILGLPQVVDSAYIKPRGQITISAWGKIKSISGNAPKSRILKLGFVQTLIDCCRRGYYTHHCYVEGHTKYPVKDGEGKPWFKSEAINLVTVKNDEINPSEDFRIEVTDEPHCSFPLVCLFVESNDNLAALDFHDSFKTCLLARVYVGDGRSPGHAFEDQAFLHEVTWDFNVGGQYAAGPPPSVTRPQLNGYRLGGSGLAIPWPHARPVGIVLDTSPMDYRDGPDGTQVPISTSANATKQCKVIRLPNIVVKRW